MASTGVSRSDGHVTNVDFSWTRLFAVIDDGIRSVANNANVSHEELRQRYVLACLRVSVPFENKELNEKGDWGIARQGDKEEGENDLECSGQKRVSQPTNVAAVSSSSLNNNGIVNEQSAAGDISTRDSTFRGCEQSKLSQNAHAAYGKGYQGTYYQQHITLNTQQKMNGRQRNQHSHQLLRPSETTAFAHNHGLSNRAPSHYEAFKQVHFGNARGTNRPPPCKINGNVNFAHLNSATKGKDVKEEKVPKFYCDIEAALAGELSDLEDDDECHKNIPNKLGGEAKAARTSASLAKETISTVEAQFKDSKIPEARVISYPAQKALALNVLYKIYIVYVEDHCLWGRLCDGNPLPCFDASHVQIDALRPLSWEEIAPGTPCTVLAPFTPLDVSNDGIPREITEFKAYARAVVEKSYESTKTVRARLVDFGFCVNDVPCDKIKPLTLAFDGPPLAIRLHSDLVHKSQREALAQYSVACVRLAVARDRHYLCWARNWKVIDAQKQNWAKEDDSLCVKPAQSRGDNEAASNYIEPSVRAFISSWLNNEHKSAGGRGIEAALCEIANEKIDIPAPELTASPVFESRRCRISVQSTQSSTCCTSSPQKVESPYSEYVNDNKINEVWPALSHVIKVKKSKQFVQPKEVHKKEINGAERTEECRKSIPQNAVAHSSQELNLHEETSEYQKVSSSVKSNLDSDKNRDRRKWEV